MAGGASRTNTQFAQDVARMRRLRADFRVLIRGTRERLAALYASALPDAEKRAQKAAIFADMRGEYERIKGGWDGAPVFDRWFASGANNAGIVAAGLYADRVPQFAALLAAEGGDLPRFYERVRVLAALPKGGTRPRARRSGRPPSRRRVDGRGAAPLRSFAPPRATASGRVYSARFPGSPAPDPSPPCARNPGTRAPPR